MAEYPEILQLSRQMDSFNFRSGLSFANQPRNGRRCTVF